MPRHNIDLPETGFARCEAAGPKRTRAQIIRDGLCWDARIHELPGRDGEATFKKLEALANTLYELSFAIGSKDDSAHITVLDTRFKKAYEDLASHLQIQAMITWLSASIAEDTATAETEAAPTATAELMMS